MPCDSQHCRDWLRVAEGVFIDQIPNANWLFAVGSVDQAKIEFSKTEAGHTIDSVHATVYHMRHIMSTGLY